jgi:hypothetical protein
MVVVPVARASPLDRAGWSRPVGMGTIDVSAEPVIEPTADGRFVASWPEEGIRIPGPGAMLALRALGRESLGDVRRVDLGFGNEFPDRVAAAAAGTGTVVLMACTRSTTPAVAPYIQDSVRAITLLPSGALSPPTTLASGDAYGEGLYGCDVAVDANDIGQTALAWTAHYGGAEQMEVSVRAPDGTEIRRQELVPPAGNGRLAVDLDNAGDLTVVWAPDADGLYVATGFADQPFSVRRLAPDLPESGRLESEAYDSTPDGRQGLAWREGTYDKWVLRAATAGPGAPFGSPQRIARNGAESPSVAIGRNGDTVVLWREHDGRVRATRASANGRFGPPMTLSGPDALAPDLEEFGGEQRLAVARDGTAIAAWRSAADRPASRIHVAEGSRGGWRSIASYPAPGSFGVDMAGDDSGHVVVTWDRIALRGQRIEAAIRLRGGGFSHPIQLWPVRQYGSYGESLETPGVLIGASGNALVWWKRKPIEGDEGWAVSLRRFADAGQGFRREPPERGSRRPRARSRR